MKHTKKLLALAISLLLLIGFIPVHASTIVESGTCGAKGNNVTWTLDSDGLLTISGTGAMENYAHCSSPFYNNNNIKKVVIKEGVTSIGDAIFCECIYLKEITIPNSITMIGWYAFDDCESLIKIKIPKSVINITMNPFRDCFNLEEIEVEKENAYFYSAGNCLINRENKELIAGCRNSVIPDDNRVEIIGEEAFLGCRHLKAISIPDSVKRIETWAFALCSSLTSIFIPANIDTLGTNEFEGLTLGLSDNPFCGCEKLNSITVSPENKYYYADGNCLIDSNRKRLISGCNSSVIPSDSRVTSIAPRAFDHLPGIKQVFIPKNISKIYPAAFCSCSGIESIIVDSENNEYYSQNNCLVSKTNGTIILGCKNSIIPDNQNVAEIGLCAFYNCTGLKSIAIPKGITTIQFNAFADCINLKRVEMSEGMKNIEMYAFEGCNIADVYYSGNKETWELIMIDIGNDALFSATIHYNYKRSVAPVFLSGDVSGDGEVSAEDARLALRAAVGLENYAAGSAEFLAADVDKSGDITSADARLILRRAVGFNDPEFAA